MRIAVGKSEQGSRTQKKQNTGATDTLRSPESSVPQKVKRGVI